MGHVRGRVIGRHWISAAVFVAALIGGFHVFAPERSGFDSTALAQSTTATPICFTQSDLDGSWLRQQSWGLRECFISDSCSGGTGQSWAGCTKWATGPNEPAIPWPEDPDEAALAKTAAQRITPPEDQIPLDHGLYKTHLQCDGAICGLRRWRANARVPLYEEPDQFSRSLGRTRRNEIVSAVDAVRYAPVRRAVMLVGLDNASTGDIVFILGSVCKGYTAWRRGVEFYVEDDQVSWDPPARLFKSRAGNWVQIERANGQRGWMRIPALGGYFTDLKPPPRNPTADEEIEDMSCE